MIRYFKRLPLPRQLSLAVMFSILVTAVGSLFIIGKIIIKEIDIVTDDNLLRETDIIAQQLTSEYQQIVQRTETLSKILANDFADMVVEPNKTVNNSGIESPLATIHGETINSNFTLVDKFTEITGATATVFIRNGDDFLRVSTSLRNLSNQRVYGTYLGRNHPGYQQLMQGEAYVGAANLFGKNYMTKYQPVRKNNQTIAIIYIGVAYDDILTQINNNLRQISIGKGGFVFVSDIAENEADLLIHPQHANKNLYQVYQSAEQSFKAMFANNAGLLRYQDNKGAERKVGYRYVDGWNWVVSLDIDANEQVAVIEETLLWLSLASLASSIVLSALIWLFIKHGLSPLKEITDVFKKIGSGDLTHEFTTKARSNSRNEIDHLKVDISKMTTSLQQLIGQILASSERLLDSSDAIAVANKSLSERSEEVNNESFQVSSAISQMALSVEEVARNSEEVSAVASNTTAIAVNGNEAVTEIERSMSSLSNAFSHASDTIKVVANNTQSIGEVVDVINSIADQTNLLALNAAIEAARAGESGRGFAVVADEVRELAQRTQQSTEEIRQVVEKLQQNTQKAVQGMEAGNEQVTVSVKQVKESKALLNEIEQSMGDVESRIGTIASATSEQSVVSTQITQSAKVLKENAQDAANQSDISNQHTNNVTGLAVKLQSDLSMFTI